MLRQHVWNGIGTGFLCSSAPATLSWMVDVPSLETMEDLGKKGLNSKPPPPKQPLPFKTPTVVLCVPEPGADRIDIFWNRSFVHLSIANSAMAFYSCYGGARLAHQSQYMCLLPNSNRSFCQKLEGNSEPQRNKLAHFEIQTQLHAAIEWKPKKPRKLRLPKDAGRESQQFGAPNRRQSSF